MDFIDSREDFEKLLNATVALAEDLEAKVNKIFGSDDPDFLLEVDRTFEEMKKARDV